MKYVEWDTFRTMVDGRYKSDRKCPVRVEIYKQLDKLTNKDISKWEKYIDEAKRELPISSITTAESLRDSFQKGKGSKDIATAIYFWFHSTKGLKPYARAIDNVVFRGKFEKTHIDLQFRITGDIEDLTDPVLDAVTNIPVPVAEIGELKCLIKSYDLENQKYPALVRLVVMIEEIMGKKCIYIPGNEELYNFRYILASKTVWIEPAALIKGGFDAQKWRTKYQNHSEFYEDINGGRFALIGKDGTRVDADTLHNLESWFVLIARMYNDAVIEPRDIDVFIRYLLAFAGGGRSAFLKDYFNDESSQVNSTLRMAIRRASVLDIDLRDYRPFDSEYNKFYMEIMA